MYLYLIMNYLNYLINMVTNQNDGKYYLFFYSLVFFCDLKNYNIAQQ